MLMMIHRWGVGCQGSPSALAEQRYITVLQARTGGPGQPLVHSTLSYGRTMGFPPLVGLLPPWALGFGLHGLVSPNVHSTLSS